MTIRAVLTGDIVNSTKLSSVAEKKLMNELVQLLKPYTYEFYRGDSFQVYLLNPLEAFKIALLCRTVAMSISLGREAADSDIRVSIGLGEVPGEITNLHTAKGEAFVLSGRAFDKMAIDGDRIIISSGNSLANAGLQVIADYSNSLLKTMTKKQARVIFSLLSGQSQLEVAEKLNKSKSTISQHASAGGWAELEKLLHHYQNIINHLT